ncbi:MAG: hypothetical protein BGN83_13015 [Rhizobium sp. 63-7]|nr:MAG: hypothetical protein BGN83_13015 [Rhizobium sp. 63-7]
MIGRAAVRAGESQRVLACAYGAPSSQVTRRAEAIAAICADFGVPLQAAAIQFPLRSSLVRAEVLGMSRPERVAQNLEWAKLSIPEAMWQAIDAAL